MREVRPITRWLLPLACSIGLGCIDLPGALPAATTPDDGPPPVDAAPTADTGADADHGPDADAGPTPETCNGLDDDGDGAADEGVLNRCGGCGDLPLEICDAFDNDCDLVVDEAPECECATGVDEACGVDVGECVAGIRTCDADGSWGACDALGPVSESCNGLDDDCDGSADEAFPNLGEACAVGVGACRTAGTFICMGLGETGCGAEAGPPADEACNGLDDDCDAAVDEDVGGRPCGTGEPGRCAAGTDLCEGGALRCVRSTGPGPETCDGVDEDCDGTTDEGLGGDPCETGAPGRCSPGVRECTAGAIVCAARENPIPEVCDAIDDDCDGVVDEETGGDRCQTGQPGRCSLGATRCLDGAIGCVALQGPTPEVCDGEDQDCDGAVDEEGVCGLFAQRSCRLYMGWADELTGPRDASPTWAECPAVDRFLDHDIGCVGTRGDGDFAILDLGGDVDENDQFGWTMRCADDGDPGLAAWAQRSCALFVAYADRGGLPDEVAEINGCPAVVQNPDRDGPCTSTGFDGQFRELRTDRDVGEGHELAFAWLCRDPTRPGLAATMTTQVEVFFGMADQNEGPEDGAGSWGDCPPQRSDQGGDVRCISTMGDGLFHRLRLGGDVNGNNRVGVALKAR